MTGPEPGAPTARPSGDPVAFPTIAVVGATATGKSGLALDLAERLEAEIVNADAMQLYRGMDIGTAKLPLDERRGIPHHQLDVLDVTQEATVAAYQQAARSDLGRRPYRRSGRPASVPLPPSRSPPTRSP